MDAIGEAVENVGLAQEIQKGLAKSLQKPPKFAEWQGEIDAKAAEIKGMSPADVKKEKLYLNILTEAKVVDPAFSDDDFASNDKVVGVMAKYKVLMEKVAADSVGKAQFEEVRPLGKGAFGAVFLTFKKDTGAPFAVKKMVKAIAKQNKMIKDVLIEREVLSKCASPFLVNLMYAFQDVETIFLVLTLCAGGDLAFVLSQRYKGNKKDGAAFDPLPDGAVKFYGASMAAGLQAIHDAGYVYRDLKPQNVLLTVEGHVKISDMGLTADISKGPIKQCSGTRGYWSPETIKKESYTTQPDYWSLGVTMFVLQSDKLPFHGKGDEEKDAATCAGEIDFKHGEPADLQEVVKALCTIDQTKRLGSNGGLEEVKKHPYFAGLNWDALYAGTLPVPIEPNPNDINAPSKSEIAAFKKPKDVDWTDDDQKDFASWDFMNKEMWADEAMFRIRKYKDLSGGGGGGCCVIA